MLESQLLPYLLVFMGLGLILLEVFVPSAGIIGVLAGILLIAGIAIGFMQGTKTGVILLLITAVGVPSLMAFWVKVWPHTPIGKAVYSRPPTEKEVLPDGEHYEGLKQLVGKQGKAQSQMLLSGVIKIDGQSYDAISDGVAVEPGQIVEVISVEANRILVRPLLENEPFSLSRPQNDLDQFNSENILDQPAESFGLDSPDDPPR
jgi:membrane-bound ClpP family serine protease